jgi:MSHA pilin protein MshD
MRIFSKSHSGLSLIEVIIFILILSIALGAIISVYIYTTRHSANTLFTLKTVELSQALMDEILSKAYDENTPVGGGCVKGYASTSCTSSTTAQALLVSNFGINTGETRSRFDDIDDYHDLAYCGAGVTTADLDASCSGTCSTLIDETGADISTKYAGYSVCIKISFAGSEMNTLSATTGSTVTVNNNDAKRIDLIVQDPLDARLIYTAYKTNY